MIDTVWRPTHKLRAYGYIDQASGQFEPTHSYSEQKGTGHLTALDYTGHSDGPVVMLFERLDGTRYTLTAEEYQQEQRKWQEYTHPEARRH